MVAADEKGRRSLRVLVAEDNAQVRQELCGLLGLLPGVEVVGEAAGGVNAARLAMKLRPDVVLLGLEIRDPDARETARRIREGLPHCRLVALTLHGSEGDRDATQFAEFEIVVGMGAPLETLLAAILGAPVDEGGGNP